jgi:hypothetical protein
MPSNFIPAVFSVAVNRTLSALLAVCSFALATLTSVPGFAQERPKTEFSAGYDFLRLTGDAAQNLPSGWYGEIASFRLAGGVMVSEQNPQPLTFVSISRQPLQ